MNLKAGRPDEDKVKSDDMVAMLTKDREFLSEQTRGNPRSNIHRVDMDDNKAMRLESTLSDVTEVLRRDQIKHIKKVDFDDIDEVKSRTIEYFESCQASRHFPSVMTLCSIGYGCDRSTLDIYLNKHNNESASYIRRVKDIIADTLTNAALYSAADNVSVIFQLKNLHGFADNIRVEAGAVMPDIQVDKEAIRKRHTFKDITPEDDDE